MRSTNRVRAGVVAGACVVVGVAGGIAGSAAAPSKKSSSRSSTTATPGNPPAEGWRRGGPFGPGGPGGRGMRGFGGPPVHSEEVVLNRAGDAYITLTEESGTVKSVSGNEVVITEGTAKVPYKDVTVTVPDSATVVRNAKKAAVGDLKEGDIIHVSSSSDGVDAFAFDASFKPRFGGPGRGDHDGPPPAPPTP